MKQERKNPVTCLYVHASIEYGGRANRIRFKARLARSARLGDVNKSPRTEQNLIHHPQIASYKAIICLSV